jgi:hypothetical protein
MTEEETGFTVVDRRRAARPESESVAPTPETSATEEAPAPPPQTDSPAQSFPDDTLPRLTIRDRLLMSIDILQQGAWIAMGLIPDPATGQKEPPDMAAARTAIDCVTFIAKQVEGTLDNETRMQLRGLLNDLQLYYVKLSQR